MLMGSDRCVRVPVVTTTHTRVFVHKLYSHHSAKRNPSPAIVCLTIKLYKSYDLLCLTLNDYFIF